MTAAAVSRERRPARPGLRQLWVSVVRALLIVAAATVLVFFVTTVLSDPARQLLPLDAPEEEVERTRQRLGLDRRLIVQFGDFALSAATFDFDDSFWQRRPSTEIVFERLPRTLLLIATSQTLAISIGVPLGIAMALSSRRWITRIGDALSLVMVAIPGFWLALLLIIVFSLTLGWLPTSGIGGIRHLVLPSIALSVSTAGRLAQMTRTSIEHELEAAYVRTAYGKGLSRRRVAQHTLRNALIPIAAVSSWETVTALSGYTVIAEYIFAYPGVGQLLVDALRRQDLPLTHATVMVLTMLVVFANLVIDFVFRRLDPRIGLGET